MSRATASGSTTATRSSAAAWSAASLTDGFDVAGESAGFEPEPDPARVDVLLFDLEGGGLQRAVRLTAGYDVRLVGVARSPGEEALLDAVQAGLAGFLSGCS